MASDPARPDDLFTAGHKRDGKFATYDSLSTYYVGYGGNSNTTTRFRRYDGAGTRPLLPEHDLSAPEFLLKADHDYRIELSVSAQGRVRFVRDGMVIFDWQDPEPLRSGWFGFRTVDSRLEISDFQVHGPATAGAAGR
jgi:predicted AlkP superfamily pyrophosphatase or phosphodiesterase